MLYSTAPARSGAERKVIISIFRYSFMLLVLVKV